MGQRVSDGRVVGYQISTHIFNPFSFSCGKFSFSINLGIQVLYKCEKGVSDNWKKENENERGPEEGQVLSEIVERDGMTQDECRIKCEKDGAYAFNWKADRPQGCRCYGKKAALSINIDNTANWLYCKKTGKVIGIGNSYTYILIFDSTYKAIVMKLEFFCDSSC